MNKRSEIVLGLFAAGIIAQIAWAIGIVDTYRAIWQITGMIGVAVLIVVVTATSWLIGRLDKLFSIVIVSSLWGALLVLFARTQIAELRLLAVLFIGSTLIAVLVGTVRLLWMFFNKDGVERYAEVSHTRLIFTWIIVVATLLIPLLVAIGGMNHAG